MSKLAFFSRLVVMTVLVALPVKGARNRITVRGAGRHLTEAEDQMVIRAAYDKLASYTVPSGNPLAFEIKHFRTVNMATELWMDVLDMTGGEAIYTTRVDNGSGVYYNSTWDDAADLWMHWAETQTLPGKTVQNVLDLVAGGGESRFASIVRVSQAVVNVTLAGKWRLYRSIFLWDPPTSETTHSFFPLDMIV